ncbi:glycosyltransferase [Thalassovita taeanensis]|uniref:Glycosyltransferase involved in cell wall bisynthesis n=1 Tax=Thalassovita taeanensis TaxID=657014 RepID=A0A1H9CGY9_9RHOB|nr:glycosyltransferase [Thalassovita taeanensis]SEQ00476.1 Glycosyltransferase involved in cell wall bisynthesis [Thalassovita taeanensis]
MKILFIHQNFPGQFKHLAPALAKAGHEVVALTLRVKKPGDWQGVKVLPYAVQRKQGQGAHPWVLDFDTKVIRGEACFNAACRLRAQGFSPDIIVAHPGWGESMFLRDVWPEARIGLYYELYHISSDEHLGFDPEFQAKVGQAEHLRIRLKNLNNRVHFPVGDLGISPTEFQAGTFPPEFREKISVIHDGIDTDHVVANEGARFTLPDGSVVTRDDEVITFVNRNLEPYRGYHIFMRALPQLLKERPNAKVLIVGGDDVSYGARPPKGQTWKQIFIDEVRGRIPTPNWSRVHFLGRIPYDQFVTLLQVSRVHVYLTYPFVLSWSLFEAMSAQAAIVASNTAPLHEAIRHGETGRLVDFFDGDALVAEVCALLQDAEARAALGRAARAHVVANYDLKSICLPKQLEWIERLYQTQAGTVGD